MVCSAASRQLVNQALLPVDCKTALCRKLSCQGQPQWSRKRKQSVQFSFCYIKQAKHRQRWQQSAAAYTTVLASTTSVAAAATVNAAAFSSILTSLGIFIISIAAAIFLLAAIPTLLAAAKAAYRLEKVLGVVEKELPETAATLRLSGLEVAECINQLGGLGGELSQGVRSTANMVTAAEQGLKQGVTLAEYAVTQKVKPAVSKAEASVRSKLEQELQERAKLSYTKPLIAQLGQVASSTSATVRKLRTGLFVTSLATQTVKAGVAVRSYLNTQRTEQQNLGSSTSSTSKAKHSVNTAHLNGNVPNDPWLSAPT